MIWGNVHNVINSDKYYKFIRYHTTGDKYDWYKQENQSKMINSKNKNTKTGVYLNCIDLEIKNQLSFIMEWWHISLEYNNLILWENYVEQNFNFTMLWIQQWQSYPCDLWASLFVLSFFFAQPNFSFLHWLVVWAFWEEEGSYPQQFDLPSFSLQVCSIV